MLTPLESDFPSADEEGGAVRHLIPAAAVGTQRPRSLPHPWRAALGLITAGVLMFGTLLYVQPFRIYGVALGVQETLEERKTPQQPGASGPALLSIGTDCGESKDDCALKGSLPEEIDRVQQASRDSSCSGMGEDCSQTQCCKGAGMQCYQKNDGWAQCKAECKEGAPDPTDGNGDPWTCHELGPRSEGAGCADSGQSCADSQCCKEAGMQCFRKNASWAGCRRQGCTPGIDMTTEGAGPEPWSCEPLGGPMPGRKDWVQEECAGDFEDCTKKRCCSVTGYQCYEQNPYFGTCEAECPEGWGCKELGFRTPKSIEEVEEESPPVTLAPWVKEHCSAGGENCKETKCCAEPGNQCYEKNPGWYSCMASCNPGPIPTDMNNESWTCKTLGVRTPGKADRTPAKAAPWVKQQCSSKNEDCTHTKCCKYGGMQCYQREDTWATCQESCAPGPNLMDEGREWSCKELGSRTPRNWGNPSLFCFSVFMQGNYELKLMKGQLEADAGIFACDDFLTLSEGTENWELEGGPLGKVHVQAFRHANVGTSKDGTAGNAKLFMNVWEAVRVEGTWEYHDWTIKADPDAVLVPDRLRLQLGPHTKEKAFVINCDKHNGMQPMMFGSLEALSKAAVRAYSDGHGECEANLPWQTWGEDLYLGRCLQMLGVRGVQEYHLISDGVCNGVDCSDGKAAAFHPKKDVDSWLACWKEATSR